jgi:hypothetical protein
MKSKSKSTQEFIFTSPFALKDSTSRLRRLAQRRRWKINLELTEDGDYSFYAALRRWLPLSISGTLQRDGNNTIVTCKVDINWMLLAMMTMTIIGLVIYQWSSPLIPFQELNSINNSPYSADTWVNVPFYIGMVLGQLALVIVVYLAIRRVFSQHKQMGKLLENALMDAIPDLPQVNTFIDEDGELLVIDDEYDMDERNFRRIG